MISPSTSQHRPTVRRMVPVFLLSIAAVLFLSGETRVTRTLRRSGIATTAASTSLIRPLSPLAQQQAANYRAGSGLLLNVHITHHGGTTFCNTVGRAGPTPSQACWKVRGEDHVTPNYPHHNPWNAQETAPNIQTARKFFHMISWEYEQAPVDTPLAATDWQDPNLLSVLVIRDPLKRLLAGDAKVARDYPGVPKGTASRETLERFAATSPAADNYALRILSGKRDGPVTRTDLQAAKDLVSQFSVVVDIECLSESLKLLASKELNVTLGRIPAGRNRASPRERIGHEDIYESLRAKNALDIELYEWSKDLAYLDCARKDTVLL